MCVFYNLQPRLLDNTLLCVERKGVISEQGKPEAMSTKSNKAVRVNVTMTMLDALLCKLWKKKGQIPGGHGEQKTKRPHISFHNQNGD